MYTKSRKLNIQLLKKNLCNCSYLQMKAYKVHSFQRKIKNEICCCCCRPQGGTDTTPSSPLQAPPQLIRPAGQQPRAPPGIVGPRSVGNLGQPNMCLVSCGCEWHRGQFGVGYVSGVILSRYLCRIGDLFVRGCARSVLV